MKRYEILNIICGAIIEVSPAAAEMLSFGNDRKADLFFVDLGVNSIDYAEIAYSLMNKLNVTQPIDIFTCTNRISDVVDILYDLTNQEKVSDKEQSATGYSHPNPHIWADTALS